jgi:L-asparaginase
VAKKKKTSILIIYTGGTIGMVHDSETGVLHPFSFDQILLKMPELMHFNYDVSAVAFNPPIDSSDIKPELWVKIVNIIEEEYLKYDGFVILHGTDTMAYTASVLSFMLQNLTKPVILTGSQLPIGALRTDGKENIISSIEIAARKENGKAMVPEVCIFFENKLLRGNRTTKENVEDFNAFVSKNYPPLAETGVHIRFNTHNIQQVESDVQLITKKKLSDSVIVMRIFPGMNKEVFKNILTIKNLKGIILQTFGAGNAMSDSWFEEELTKAVKRGIYILNVSQCSKGSVEMGTYEASMPIKNAGVLNGGDITIEAAITKMMYVLGNYSDSDDIKEKLQNNIAGELTV